MELVKRSLVPREAKATLLFRWQQPHGGTRKIPDGRRLKPKIQCQSLPPGLSPWPSVSPYTPLETHPWSLLHPHQHRSLQGLGRAAPFASPSAEREVPVLWAPGAHPCHWLPFTRSYLYEQRPQALSFIIVIPIQERDVYHFSITNLSPDICLRMLLESTWLGDFGCDIK